MAGKEVISSLSVRTDGAALTEAAGKHDIIIICASTEIDAVPQSQIRRVRSPALTTVVLSGETVTEVAAPV